MPSKVHCPRCHTEATEFPAFLLIKSSVAYCKKCGWNIGNATTKLRTDMWILWVVTGIGFLVAAKAWMRGSGFAVAVAFSVVALPFSSALMAKYRLSRIAVMPPSDFPQEVEGSTQALADPQSDGSLTMRPRRVRLTMRGYFYIAGTTLATGFVLWVFFLVLSGVAGAGNAAMNSKFVMALLIWGWTFWSCISFFRNRIRERRLFIDGELSQGMVLAKTKTRYGSLIVYRYRDAGGRILQNRTTDFSNKLYEEMPINVFYDPTNSNESAALECSLYQVG